MRLTSLKKGAWPLLFLLGCASTSGGTTSTTPAALHQENQPADYWVYVANESSDLVSRLRFGPDGIEEEKTIEVGIHPTDLDGAHGLTVAPGGHHWYLSFAHGTPFGKIWKFETGTDRFVDSATVGLFPASMAVTPDQSMLFVVNFNLHGNHVPSSVSVVYTPFMREMTKIETCVMPHGGRLSADGSRHYSACMMSDQLVEIATDRLEVSRRFRLTAGHEGLLPLDDTSMQMGSPNNCKPTWVALSPNSEMVYIPCNGRKQILEIALDDMRVTRTFDTGAGPYNADVSPDGRYLVVTLKGARAITIIDLATGLETQVATTQPVVHGVAISPDSRYAFVSNEAVGATRGTIDVFDLDQRLRVASTEVQYQPGGIGFWKMEQRSSDAEATNR